MIKDSFKTSATNPAVLLGSIIVLGTVMRLVALGRESLWFDEAISYLVAQLPVSSILDNTIQDPHPPLYYVLLHFWLHWLPQKVIFGRLLSALWGIALIPVVYALSLTLFPLRRIALFAALLTAISPFQILYSYEMRMYTWLMFLVVAQTLAYFRARCTGKGIWWLLFGVLTVSSVYTHLFSSLSLLALAVHAVVHRRDRKSVRRLVAIGLCAALLFLPWILILASESEIGAGSLRPLIQDRAIEFHAFKLVTSLTFLLFGQIEAIWYVAAAFFLTLSSAFILIMEGNKSRRESIRLGGLPALMVMANIGVPVVIYFIRPFFLPERTMAAASPFLMMLLAWGTTRNGSPLPYLAGGTAVAMAIGSMLYLTGEPVKPPYRDAIRYVEQHRSDSDVVVHTSDASYLPSLAYVNISEHFLLSGDPEPRKPEEVVKALGGSFETLERLELRYNRFWLIVALEHSLEWQREQADDISSHCESMELKDFEGIAVRLHGMCKE